MEFVGTSAAAVALRSAIADAARSDAKVLICGESGVGKEIVATLIHAQSGRRRMPFLAINCAGVPDTLLESELFGSMRGSFTGADRDRLGLLQQANRGTVFLDEVGEMSLRMQGVLLRFLENGEVQRIGSARSDARVDVRVIAATNRDLAEAMAANEFRADLYYRLNVILQRVPPLRERPEDVALLTDHFLGVFSHEYQMTAPKVSPEARALLDTHSWPGNVRELKNVMERLVIRCKGRLVTPDDLPPELRPQPASPDLPPAAAPSPARADILFDRIVENGESFWSVVYTPFMDRDLTRDDIRRVIAKGLERTSGNYRLLAQLFNLTPADHTRFLGFLRKHQCQVRFQQVFVRREVIGG